MTLFLGGPNGPLFPRHPGCLAVFWFFPKLIGLLFCFVWFRASLPRFRYDQLMDLGWKVLIPLGLGWLLVLVAFRVGSERTGTGHSWSSVGRRDRCVAGVRRC